MYLVDYFLFPIGEVFESFFPASGVRFPLAQKDLHTEPDSVSVSGAQESIPLAWLAESSVTYWPARLVNDSWAP
jgi:hypothetical protein